MRTVFDSILAYTLANPTSPPVFTPNDVATILYMHRSQNLLKSKTLTLQEMEQLLARVFKLFPEFHSSTILWAEYVMAVAELGDLRKLQKVYMDIKDKSIELDLGLMNGFMKGFARFPESLEFSQILFDQLESFGIEPNLETFNIMIENAMYGFMDYGKVEQVLAKMKDRGLEPNMETYKFLIDGYSRSSNEKDIQYVFRYYEEMLAKFGDNDGTAKGITSIPVKIYNGVVRAYISSHQFEKAIELFESVKSRNVTLNSKTYEQVIDAMCKLNRLQDALTTFWTRPFGSPSIGMCFALLRELSSSSSSSSLRVPEFSRSFKPFFNDFYNTVTPSTKHNVPTTPQLEAWRIFHVIQTNREFSSFQNSAMKFLVKLHTEGQLLYRHVCMPLDIRPSRFLWEKYMRALLVHGSALEWEFSEIEKSGMNNDEDPMMEELRDSKKRMEQMKATYGYEWPREVIRLYDELNALCQKQHALQQQLDEQSPAVRVNAKSRTKLTTTTSKRGNMISLAAPSSSLLDSFNQDSSSSSTKSSPDVPLYPHVLLTDFVREPSYEANFQLLRALSHPTVLDSDRISKTIQQMTNKSRVQVSLLLWNCLLKSLCFKREWEQCDNILETHLWNWYEENGRPNILESSSSSSSSASSTSVPNPKTILVSFELMFRSLPMDEGKDVREKWYSRYLEMRLDQFLMTLVSRSPSLNANGEGESADSFLEQYHDFWGIQQAGSLYSRKSK